MLAKGAAIPSNDLLETLIAGTPYESSHQSLLRILRTKTVLDTARFATFRDGWTWSRPHCLVVDEVGNSLGALRERLPDQVAAAAGDFIKVWQTHKDGPLRLVNSHSDKLIFVAPYGDAPQEFVQLDVSLERPYIERRLFSGSPHDRPKRVEDLLEDHGCYEDTRLDGDEIAWGAPRYVFERGVDVAVLLRLADELDAKQKAANERIVIVHKTCDGSDREVGRSRFYERFPELRTLPTRERRLFEDWQRSSAGRSGARFCDHWFFDHSDYTWPDGRRAITMIPQWVTQKRLPQLTRKRSLTVYSLYDQLLKFDKKAGYPFAWYFFMLHGNRLGDWVGEMIAKGLESGAIGFPDHDRQVVLEWNAHRYGF